MQKGTKLGVIRIRSFSQTTADTVKERLQELEKAGASSRRFTPLCGVR